MPHVNARLTVHGRLLLVQGVRKQGWAVAHAAKAMGISRQCAHRWLARYDQHGGQDWIAGELGLAPRTVSRVLRRADAPYLACLDPMTGEVIRSSKATARRYERDRPGELVHVDVKRVGKIPDGGGWRAPHGRAAPTVDKHKRAKIGYDYVHSMVDDHSRLAYSEIHDDEKVDTCAGFLTRAAEHFAGHGITRIERVMTDNAFSYRHGRVHRRRRRDRGGAEVHQAALPLAEREGRTVQPHPAERMGLPVRLHLQPGTTRRPCALAELLQH